MAKQVPWTRIMSALEDLADLQGYADSMRLPAESAMEIMMHHLEAQQPIGHDEKQKGGTGRVSTRLGHTPIEKGWRDEVVLGDKSVHIRVLNISQHFAPVVGGAGAHDIPGNPRLVFWWGDPHPWPAPEYSYTGKKMGPGLYSFPSVEHPGIRRPNPFVRNSRSLAMPGMANLIKSGTEHYIWDVMSSAGLRRVK